MKKYIVTLEISKKLKEIGFDEPCSYTYQPSVGNECFRIRGIQEEPTQKNSYFMDDDIICAPYYEQVFDWFRENYNLYHEISPKLSYPDNAITGFEFYSKIWNDNGEELMYDDGVRDYRECKIACIDKMILHVRKELGI